jgi:hypothetical protein
MKKETGVIKKAAGENRDHKPKAKNRDRKSSLTNDALTKEGLTHDH